MLLLSKIPFQTIIQNYPTPHHLTSIKQNDFIWNKKGKISLETMAWPSKIEG